MQFVAALVFWMCLAGLTYNYVVYPVLICLVASWKGHRPGQPEVAEPELPAVTVVIAAYNAESQIRERITNLLACSYPHDKLNILVASDGSTDGTVSAVESFAAPNIHAIAFEQRRGKAATLADAVSHAKTEIILFTDATTRFDALAIRRLAPHFADPNIGLVSGHISIVDQHGKPAESFYWRCETRVRRAEAALGVMLGASGAIYAIRRQLFVEPARPVINDDMVFPMLLRLRHGSACVYEETAVAYAINGSGLRSEFARRCRIGAGAYQSLPMLRAILSWQHRKHAFAFFSHKLLRWISPFLMLSLLPSNFVLTTSGNYRIILCLQTCAYVLALIGLFTASQKHPLARVSRIATSFVAMNLALLCGFCRWLLAPQRVVWNPTARPLTSSVAWDDLDEKRSAA